MAIKICPKCGGKVSTARNICIHCGYIFPSLKRCPDCEETVPIDAKECPSCGYPFVELEFADPVAVESEDSAESTAAPSEPAEPQRASETEENSQKSVTESDDAAVPVVAVADTAAPSNPVAPQREKPVTAENYITDEEPPQEELPSDFAPAKTLCPYCGTDRLMMLGTDFFMCETCKGRFLNRDSSTASETVANGVFGAASVPFAGTESKVKEEKNGGAGVVAPSPDAEADKPESDLFEIYTSKSDKSKKAEDPSDNEEKTGKRSALAIVIPIVIVLLAAVGVFAFLMFRVETFELRVEEACYWREEDIYAHSIGIEVLPDNLPKTIKSRYKDALQLPEPSVPYKRFVGWKDENGKLFESRSLFNASYKLTAVFENIKSISVSALPKKTSYFVGDQIDLQGVSVLIEYESGSTKQINEGFEYSPKELTNVGENDVTISYGGKTTTFTVTVNAITVSSISVKAKPTKTTYNVGETLNTAGMSLTVNKSNGTSETITSGFTCSPTALNTAGTQTVTVSYGGKTTTFTVTVNAITVSSISVKAKPTKTTYNVGETLNTAGMSLTVNKSNGTSETITSGFTCSPTALNTAGTQTVTVSYGGKTATFTVTVNNSSATTSVKVGDTVTFGHYEQDNNTSNGKEEIKWRVLAVEGNKALIISEYALDAKPYNTTNTNVTWETCTLRKWLNGDFLNAAFSAEEQKRIATTNVTADKNPNYSTNPGNATNDKIFLLSITEANKYFSSDEARKCAPTAYAKAQGAYTSSSNKTASGEATCWWWLRSPGSRQYSAADVRRDGSVGSSGEIVSYDDDCVRPALWINLDS